MKKQVTLITLALMTANTSFAQIVCSITKQSSPGQFTETIAMKSVENPGETPQFLHVEGRETYYLTEQDGRMGIFVADLKAPAIRVGAFGDGKTVALLDFAQDVGVACVKVP